MISIKRIALAAIVCMVTLFASSCAQNNNEQTTQTSSAAISFTDDDGKLIELDKPAERIISLYSAHTENLYTLGADNLLIGTYKTCVYPPAAAFTQKYDYSADPEKIIAADPDVVIIRPFISRKVPELAPSLEKAGIKVVSLYPDSFDKFDDYIQKLALITGTEETAKKKLAEFHERIDSVKKLTASVPEDKKQTVFFESTEVNIRTVTPESMPGRAIEYAGGINLAADAEPMEEGSSIASFGVEKVLENADKIDVYVSQRGSMNSGGNLISIGERAGYDTIKAVKDGRVYLINEKTVSSPTFRYAKGVYELARFMYPELTDDVSEYDNDDKATRRAYADMVVKTQHMPLYLPTSSSYYTSSHKGHVFGLFEDVPWTDKDFDNIETAVESGCIDWKKDGDKELYEPEGSVTREELAKTVFILGDFVQPQSKTSIEDIGDCENAKIVQSLVDNKVFELEDGKFNPKRTVTNKEVLAALAKTGK